MSQISIPAEKTLGDKENVKITNGRTMKALGRINGQGITSSNNAEVATAFTMQHTGKQSFLGKKVSVFFQILQWKAVCICACLRMCHRLLPVPLGQH